MMRELGEAVVILIFFLSVIEATKFKPKTLPSFITACKRADPNKGDCSKNSANAALPYLVKGNDEYKIPNLVPLDVKQMNVSSGDLKLVLSDVYIYGLDRMKVDELKIYTDKQNGYIIVNSDWLNVDSQYDIKGKLLLLNLYGSGPANLTFYENRFKYTFNFDLYTKNDLEYLRITNSSTEIDIKNAYFNFENLFGKNQELGKQINNVLNDNAKEVVQEVGVPVISEMIQVILSQVLNAILKVVPYDTLFPL